MATVATMTEYLERIKPRIFRKQVKAEGRAMDLLFQAIGDALTFFRDDGTPPEDG
jgi:hypothetical protein